MIEVPFNEADQRRLSLVGGQITIKPSGMPVFQFKSKEQFNLFVSLKNVQNGGKVHATN
ncbi:hypothetical protein [Metabacillus sp. FJAT-53654]|uniref:Uncharacterized protein n=1 Tax=Metabacillus rhizosphaerae TaxID=3117747 RepID=A0ABZ2MYD6_9BACI